MKNRFIITALLSAAFIFSGGCGGTGIGNGLENEYSDPHSGQGTPVSYLLVEVACLKLKQCNSPAPINCENEVMQSTTIDTEIGLNVGAYSSYAQVVAADVTGSITANTTAANVCLQEIRNLSCSDAAVQNAYQPLMAQPFAQIAGIFPVSCQGIF